MASKVQKKKTIVWTDEEVGLLLDVFAEETIQIGLEKAKCPKDKNAVYLEVQKKLERKNKKINKNFVQTPKISSVNSVQLKEASGLFSFKSLTDCYPCKRLKTNCPDHILMGPDQVFSVV